jgi:ubiquinol-cytochrome c reductase cytochrome b subunit
VIKRIVKWLDHRAGVRKLFSALLLEGVPGGAKWRYVWGSCLAFVFTIQLVTGILLMTAYSPSSSQAWSSVHFIQYRMDFGWLIRGLHHFGSQTMVVLMALHMLQVVIAGAHLPPREVNWWLGIGLLSVTLGLSLTGYLLPWDQKGYWATRVATNIASNIPVFGDDIKQLAVGGPDYGNHTLTRFYALHVGILPLSLIVLLVAHLFIFRRHGVTSPENIDGLVSKPENEHGAEMFWPRQAFYDMVACMVVFSIMMGLVLYGFSHEVEAPPAEDGAQPGLYEQWAHAGQQGKGAELDAAADRDTANYSSFLSTSPARRF